jgi:hypothetical protein
MKRWTLVLASLLSFLVCAPAWATSEYSGNCRRGVNYGGNVHYISINSDKLVAHYQKAITSTNDPWASPLFGAPTATLILPQHTAMQKLYGGEVGQGVVVFGSTMIHYAIINYPDVNSGDAPVVIVSRFDLTTSKFLDPEPIVVGIPYHNKRSAYGVAAAVLQGKIYVFTNSATYVSGDGQSYQLLQNPNYPNNPYLPISTDLMGAYEPMDAVTFYPEDGPAQIMVAFLSGKSTPKFVIWDGDLTTLGYTTAREFPVSQGGWGFYGGALVLGTMGEVRPHYHDLDGNHRPGGKNPCVQAFFNAFTDVPHCEYNIKTDTVAPPDLVASIGGTNEIYQFVVFPWYENLTGTFNEQKPSCPILRQNIGVDLRYITMVDTRWDCSSYLSDFMVPQNYTTDYGWDGIPNPTGKEDLPADEAALMRKYWSIEGVVLGSPPFEPMYDLVGDMDKVSNVLFAYETTSTVEQTHTWTNRTMFSSKTELKAGVPEEDYGSANVDLSYGHAWEGAHSTTNSFTTSWSIALGTQNEQAPPYGTRGWALCAKPLLFVQDYKIYAYDFDIVGGTGTELVQDYTTITQGTVETEAIEFSLANPGGPQDDYPGFMTMQTNPITGLPYTFPLSTDLVGWNDQKWEVTGAPWNTVYGSATPNTNGGQMVPHLEQGSSTSVHFGKVSETVDSSGQSDSFDVKVGLTLNKLLGLTGFAFNEQLTSGYAGEWSTDTKTTTDISENLEIQLTLPHPSPPCLSTDENCVDGLHIQPYLLQATADCKAPWIPSGYNHNVPWCITWQVTAGTYLGQTLGPSQAPDSAGGTIAGSGNTGEAAAEEAFKTKWSDYSIHGGHMAWIGADGSATPIPMTADQFDPSLGATIQVNRHAYPTSASLGAWKRKGAVWTFKTKGTAKRDIVTLNLDFGSQRWSFEGSKLVLAENFRAGDVSARIVLTVNGKYIFNCDIQHQVKADWAYKAPSADPSILDVAKLSGSFGKEKSYITLEGTLPNVLPGFGDCSFVFNGHQIDIPLLSNKDFLKALRKGKPFVYEAEGTHITVDFKKKTWAAKFNKDLFHALMAPRWGGMKFGFKVGGITWYSKEHPINTYTSKLEYKS